MSKSTTIIAFDQHAATTVAAVLLPGHRTPALHTLASDSATILRFVDRLRRQGPVTCCYEAGPCGFELQRAFSAREIPCEVIAPALIPRRPGDRIKTDRRDAGQLAILYRAGALTAIHIPTEQEEAARDLLRCREDIRADLLRARHRLSKFLLRHGRRFTGTKKALVKTPRDLAAGADVAAPRARSHASRLPARGRGNDRPPAGRRGGPAGPARSRTAPPSRSAIALLPRHRRPDGAHHRRRTRRRAPVSDRPEHDGVCRPRTLRALERRQTRAGWDHENGQQPSAPRACRSRVALPAPPVYQCGLTPPSTRRARHRRRPGLDRAAALASPLSPLRSARQTQTAHRHCRRSRAHRLCLGRADPVI